MLQVKLIEARSNDSNKINTAMMHKFRIRLPKKSLKMVDFSFEEDFGSFASPHAQAKCISSAYVLVFCKKHK